MILPTLIGAASAAAAFLAGHYVGRRKFSVPSFHSGMKTGAYHARITAESDLTHIPAAELVARDLRKQAK